MNCSIWSGIGGSEKREGRRTRVGPQRGWCGPFGSRWPKWLKARVIWQMASTCHPDPYGRGVAGLN